MLLPFHVATPTTSESSATPLKRFLALWSSSTRSARRAAARSMPLSRNSECSGALPLPKSCAIPEGCACVRSSLAESWLTSSSGDGTRFALNSSRHVRKVLRACGVCAVLSVIGLTHFPIALR